MQSHHFKKDQGLHIIYNHEIHPLEVLRQVSLIETRLKGTEQT
jgi:hypothetical protein